jgi:prepilin-type N-terminal cleavage/methylation domain-containing protein
MFDRIRAARQNESGFTLIELLLVIVILGVLAGIVVFAVNGITDRGNASACKSDFKTVQVAQEAHYSKTGGYATSLTALKAANLLKDDTSPYVTIDPATLQVVKVTGVPAGC